MKGSSVVYQTDLLYTQANNQANVPNSRIQKDEELPPRHLAPLERSELRRERARVATQTRFPIILLLLVAGAVAFFVFNIPIGYILIAIVLILAIRWYIRFQSSSPKRRKEITEVLITKKNRTENDRLVADMQALSAEGFDGYAITLGKFLQHKCNIEKELEKRAGESPQEKQVAELVDSICFGVAEQFRSIAAIEKRLALLRDSRDSQEHQKLTDDRRELLCQVIDAYKSLKKTALDLPFILDPSATSAVERPETDLQSLVDQLREEEDIARNTRERMRRDSI